jgi:hypothetical protein
VLVLLLSSPIMVESVFAQNYSEDTDKDTWSIVLTKEGGKNPSTAPLTRKGNTWTLDSDITGTITIKQDNIVLDGNNHTLTVPSYKAGITIDHVSKVTVKNFVIKGGAIGIDIRGNSNIIANNKIEDTYNYPFTVTHAIGLIGSHNNVTGNYLKHNNVGINFVGGVYYTTDKPPSVCTNNFVVGNTIAKTSPALLMSDVKDNHIYYNNFLDNEGIVQDTGYSGYGRVIVNVWDDGFGMGNFWGDYLTRYPNATESNTPGVGDTPYFIRPDGYNDPANFSRAEAIEYWTNMNILYSQNVDQYPLLEPYGTKTPITGFELTPTIIVIATAITVAIIAVTAIIIDRHQKTRNKQV